MSVQQVLDHPVVPEEQKLALRCFLKSWYGKDAQGGWMRSQHGSKDAAALLASSFTCYPMGNRHLPCGGRLVDCPSELSAEAAVDPFRILMCGYGRKHCGRGNQCRRCALDRIDLAWSEFLPAWTKAKHWCAMVFGMDRRAEHAGIHQGDGTLDPETASVPVYQPFAGRANGAFSLHSGSELEYMVDATRNAFFDTAKKICQKGILGGAFVHHELAFSFWSGVSHYDGSHIRHRMEPHLNLLVNAPQPLDLKVIKEIYRVLCYCLRRRLPPDCRWSYPDLWFAPVLAKAGMASWLGYMLKMWRFDLWYQEALNHRCSRRELNLCFDEIVFLNGYRLAHPKGATRRYGNLRLNPKNPEACIALQIPDPMTQEQIKLCKDESYAAAHPDLVDAMFFWLEKRRKRRGHSRDDSETEY
jgi:hypothetical protein